MAPALTSSAPASTESSAPPALQSTDHDTPDSTATLAVTSTLPSYQVIDEAQWLEAGNKISILEGNATLECQYVWESSNDADCVIDAIGQLPQNISLKENIDHLFVINDKSYYIILQDLDFDRLYFRTVFVPTELLPTSTATPSG